MKKYFNRGIIAAAMLAVCSLAMATQPSNTCGNSGNNCDVGGSGGNGGAGGQGGQGGVGGQGGAGGAGYGGSATAGAAALAGANAVNKNDIRNTNSNLNAQGQQQGQEQSIRNSGNSSSTSGVKNSGNSASTSGAFSGGNTQSNAGNNAATSVTVGGDVSNYAAQERNPVSTAYAPAISPTAVCALSMSGGAQGSMFGFSVGVPISIRTASTWSRCGAPTISARRKLLPR